MAKLPGRLRLRSVWLLVLPFLWFATPTPATLAIGGALALAGLALRAAAAGYIHKEETLTTTGPYGYTRNPLYLGSLLLGIGVTAAGGSWIFVVIFLLFFAAVYPATIRHEADLLRERYPEAYPGYAAQVPPFLPRRGRWRGDGVGSAPAFSVARWWKNREYEALLGTLVGFALLALRMRFLP